MHIRATNLPDVLLVETRVLRDGRGSFRELWRQEPYAGAGVGPEFVQDNVSVSDEGVLRGLHYQHPHGQGKLVSVLSGAVYDVAVDVRRGSPTFGRWTAHELSSDNGLQLWVPPGFAHGFVSLADRTVVSYRCTEYYRADEEGIVRWNDPELAIAWPVEAPRLSEKDGAARPLREIPPERLPGTE